MKRAASHGRLWGCGGTVAGSSPRTTTEFITFRFGRIGRFAQALATGRWGDAVPVAIDIDEWLEWLLDLDGNGIRAAVFPTPDDEGVGVSPQRLKRDLETELEQFNL